MTALDHLRDERRSAALAPGGQQAAVEVPEEWKRLGFSGLFHIEAAIVADEVEVWQGRVPCRLPLGTNGPWFALRVNLGADPTVTVVRDDMTAVFDVLTTPGQQASPGRSS